MEIYFYTSFSFKFSSGFWMQFKIVLLNFSVLISIASYVIDER